MSQYQSAASRCAQAWAALRPAARPEAGASVPAPCPARPPRRRKSAGYSWRPTPSVLPACMGEEGGGEPARGRRPAPLRAARRLRWEGPTSGHRKKSSPGTCGSDAGSGASSSAARRRVPAPARRVSAPDSAPALSSRAGAPPRPSASVAPSAAAPSALASATLLSSWVRSTWTCGARGGQMALTELGHAPWHQLNLATPIRAGSKRPDSFSVPLAPARLAAHARPAGDDL
jgi:hypothetical protein